MPGRSFYFNRFNTIKISPSIITTFHYFCRFYKIGDVAQLVEHRTENPCVSGSIPLITTTKVVRYTLHN